MANETLGDAFPLMLAETREKREHGREIGPAGAFYVAVCDDLIRRAETALANGDTVAMIRIYQEMKELS